MSQIPPCRLIAALRVQRGETLAQFAAAIGCSSKSRVSEFENGKALPTLAQALRMEELSGGTLDAALLNADVAAARAAREQRTHDGASAIDDCLDADGAAAGPPAGRLILCAVCERGADDPVTRCCTDPDCPRPFGSVEAAGAALAATPIEAGGPAPAPERPAA